MKPNLAWQPERAVTTDTRADGPRPLRATQQPRKRFQQLAHTWPTTYRSIHDARASPKWSRRRQQHAAAGHWPSESEVRILRLKALDTGWDLTGRCKVSDPLVLHKSEQVAHRPPSRHPCPHPTCHTTKRRGAGLRAIARGWPGSGVRTLTPPPHLPTVACLVSLSVCYCYYWSRPTPDSVSSLSPCVELKSSRKASMRTLDRNSGASADTGATVCL